MLHVHVAYVYVHVDNYIIIIIGYADCSSSKIQTRRINCRIIYRTVQCSYNRITEQNSVGYASLFLNDISNFSATNRNFLTKDCFQYARQDESRLKHKCVSYGCCDLAAAITIEPFIKGCSDKDLFLLE